jgi:ribosomal protein L37AE/L43A
VRSDRFRHGMMPTSEATSVSPPEACPFCHSKAVETVAKVITPSTYWRCQTCGEIWHPARLDGVHQYRRSW